jgi:hypothetical protein
VTAIATSSGDTQSASASETYTKESAAGFNVMSSGATHSSGTVLTQ